MLGKSSRCDEDKIFHNGDFYGENERKNILKAEIRLFCVDCVSNLSKIYSILTLNGLFNSSYCHRDTKMLKFNYLYCDRKQVFIYIKLASLFSIRRSSELSITNSYKFFTKLLTLIKALKSQKLLKVSYNYSYLLRINNAENVRYKNLQDFVTLMSESKPRTNNNLKGKSTKLILKLISFIIYMTYPVREKHLQRRDLERVVDTAVLKRRNAVQKTFAPETSEMRRQKQLRRFDTGLIKATLSSHETRTTLT